MEFVFICICTYCLNTVQTVPWGHNWIVTFSFIEELFVHILIWIWTHSLPMFSFYLTQLNASKSVIKHVYLSPHLLASTGSYRATLKPPFLPHWTPSSSHSGPADPQRTVFEPPGKPHPQNTDSDGGFQPGTETWRRSNLPGSWSGLGRPLPVQQSESLEAPSIVSQSAHFVQPGFADDTTGPGLISNKLWRRNTVK